MEKDVVIVIPIYKEKPSVYEMISLTECAGILFNYDISIVAPAGLNVKEYIEIFDNRASTAVEYFGKCYFTNIKGYNELLLSHDFYARFSGYKYMLIHQPDVFLFHDEIRRWCNDGYDYVGAPWLNAEWHPYIYQRIRFQWLNTLPICKRIYFKIINKMFSHANACNYIVGNGGFSLRRVSTFSNLASQLKTEIHNWIYNEDLFWSIYVPMHNPKFKIPGWKTALSFGFDNHPQQAFEFVAGKLPFGAHAWFRNETPYKDNLLFWKDKISKYYQDNRTDNRQLLTLLESAKIS